MSESEIEILSEAEIAALLAAFHELELEAGETERPWWATTRRLVLVALGTALGAASSSGCAGETSPFTQVLFPGAADKAEARMFGPSEGASDAEGVETG